VKVRWGLVGTGRIALAYGEAFAKTKNAELVAVADVNMEAAQAFGERFSCRAYASHDAMLAHDRVDAVLICAPPLWHEPIAVECMERGYHVLCEKPLAITLDSAHRMVGVARRTGVLFTMASKFRYVPDMVRAHELMTAGLIGDVVLFENSFTSRVAMAGRWNADPAISGGGVLIDNGTHSVDIMRWFLGPVDVVKVVAGRNVQNLPVEDTVHLFAVSKSGVMGNVDLSWSIDKQSENYLRLFGAEGMISVGWRSSAYKRVGDAEWTIFGSGYDKNAAFVSQIETVSATSLGEMPLRVSLTDALASVEVIDAAYAAMQGSEWTPVELVRRHVA
jgi:predicted dehydrogenase